MKLQTSLGSLAVASLLFAGCVSTKPPEEKITLSTPVPIVTASPDAYAIPTLVVKGSPAPSVSPTVKGKKVMTATLIDIQTTKGLIEVELYPQDAPKASENFSTLASQGYYDGLTFHRVEPGFVIQGGDPTGTGRGGSSIFGAKFEDELNPETQSYKDGYKEGVLAMANSGPNTNGSQFFIMLEDTSLPHLYTIFGKVVKGLDVVHQIAVGDKMTTVKIVK
jgi:peptidyl-prolyl cis-trans isomerase-like 1